MGQVRLGLSPRTGFQVLRRPDPRILRLLTFKLSEHGWVDEMRHRAQGTPAFFGDAERQADEYIYRTRTVDGHAILSGYTRGDIPARTR
jgi:hypothetical protein